MGGVASRLPGILMILLLLDFTAVSHVASASGPDAASETDEGSSIDAYLAIGAAAVVGGLLLLDVLGDDDGGTEEAALVPTGVDWSVVERDVASRMVTVAVSGSGREAEEAMDAIGGSGAPAGLLLYPDPLDLGDAGGPEKFAMASGFFGVELLVVVPRDASEGTAEVYSSGGLEWSGPLAGVSEAVWYIISELEQQ